MTSALLTQLPSFLSRHIVKEPRHALALTMAWLAPIYLNEDRWDMLGDGDDLQYVVLRVTAECFPVAYAIVLSAMHNGQSVHDISDKILAEINQYLVFHMDDIEGMGWGIPYDSQGFDWEQLAEEGDWEFTPEMRNAAELLDIGQKPDDPHQCRFPDEGDFQRLQFLSDVILNNCPKDDQDAQTVATAIRYLVNSTGNTCADISYTHAHENGLEAMDWSISNIAEMNAIHREANELVEQALFGVYIMYHSHEWKTAISRWHKVFYQKGHANARNIRKWPRTSFRSTQHGTSPTTYLLQSRDHPSEAD